MNALKILWMLYLFSLFDILIHRMLAAICAAASRESCISCNLYTSILYKSTNAPNRIQIAHRINVHYMLTWKHLGFGILCVVFGPVTMMSWVAHATDDPRHDKNDWVHFPAKRDKTYILSETHSSFSRITGNRCTFAQMFSFKSILISSIVVLSHFGYGMFSHTTNVSYVRDLTWSKRACASLTVWKIETAKCNQTCYRWGGCITYISRMLGLYDGMRAARVLCGYCKSGQ